MRGVVSGLQSTRQDVKGEMDYVDEGTAERTVVIQVAWKQGSEDLALFSKSAAGGECAQHPHRGAL